MKTGAVFRERMSGHLLKKKNDSLNLNTPPLYNYKRIVNVKIATPV